MASSSARPVGAGKSEDTLLDVALDHRAHKHVKWQAGTKRAQLTYKEGSIVINYQVTLNAAGSAENALRVCRLLFQMLQDLAPQNVQQVAEAKATLQQYRVELLNSAIAPALRKEAETVSSPSRLSSRAKAERAEEVTPMKIKLEAHVERENEVVHDGKGKDEMKVKDEKKDQKGGKDNNNRKDQKETKDDKAQEIHCNKGVEMPESRGQVEGDPATDHSCIQPHNRVMVENEQEGREEEEDQKQIPSHMQASDFQMQPKLEEAKLEEVVKLDQMKIEGIKPEEEEADLSADQDRTWREEMMMQIDSEEEGSLTAETPCAGVARAPASSGTSAIAVDAAADAPGDHLCWTICRVSALSGGCPYVNFHVRQGGTKVPFQVTVLKAGSHERAKKIARLCYLKLEQGQPKDEVFEYRQSLYREVEAAGLLSVPVAPPLQAPLATRPSSAEEWLVRDVVEPFDDEANGEDQEDVDVDTVHRGRFNLPLDSPLKLEHRKSFVFAASMTHENEEDTKFTPDAAKAMPLANCPYMALGGPEIKCDLCNGDCTQTLFVIRAYRRRQCAPRRLHPSVLYAGKDCTQVLLRDRQVPPEKVMLRELERLITEDDWERHAEEILKSCESSQLADRLAKTIQRLLFGEGQRQASKPLTIASSPAHGRPSTNTTSHVKRPIAIEAFRERLKPLGMRVVLCSSAFTAVARALGHSQVALFAQRAERMVCESVKQRIAAGMDTYMACLMPLLQLLKCDADIYHSKGAESSVVEEAFSAALPLPEHHSCGQSDPLATLRLCSVSGRLAATGHHTSADELVAIKAYASTLFPLAERSEVVTQRDLLAMAKVEVAAETHWTCGACTLRNLWSASVCLVCETPRDGKIGLSQVAAVDSSAVSSKDPPQIDSPAGISACAKESDDVKHEHFKEEKGADSDTSEEKDEDSESSVAPCTPERTQVEGIDCEPKALAADTPLSRCARQPSLQAGQLQLRAEKLLSVLQDKGVRPAASSEGPGVGQSSSASTLTDSGQSIALSGSRIKVGGGQSSASSGHEASATTKLLEALRLACHERRPLAGVGGDASGIRKCPSRVPKNPGHKSKAAKKLLPGTKHSSSSSSGDSSSSSCDSSSEENRVDESSRLQRHIATLQRLAVASGGSDEIDKAFAGLKSARLTVDDLRGSSLVTSLNALKNSQPHLQQRVEGVLDCWKLQVKGNDGKHLFFRCPTCTLVINEKSTNHSQKCKGAPAGTQASSSSSVSKTIDEVVCGGCMLSVPTKDLIVHEQACRQNAVCPGCHRKYVSRSEVRQHVAPASGKGCTAACVCPACKGIIGSTPTSLKDHARKCSECAVCPGCRQLFKRGELDAHASACRHVARCEGCKRLVAKTMTHEHRTRCPQMCMCKCGSWMPQPSLKSHQEICGVLRAAALVVCEGCHGSVKASDLKQHQMRCLGMFFCQSCNTVMKKSSFVLARHLSVCPKSHHSCVGCKKYFLQNSITAHQQTCAFVKACVGCLKFFSKAGISMHLRSCQQVERCTKCERYSEKALFSKDTFKCPGCGASGRKRKRQEKAKQEKRQERAKQEKQESDSSSSSDEDRPLPPGPLPVGKLQLPAAPPLFEAARRAAAAIAADAAGHNTASSSLKQPQLEAARRAAAAMAAAAAGEMPLQQSWEMPLPQPEEKLREQSRTQLLQAQSSLSRKTLKLQQQQRKKQQQAKEQPLEEKTILIPKEARGRVIGTAGAIIKSLQSKYGVYISVPSMDAASSMQAWHDSKIEVTLMAVDADGDVEGAAEAILQEAWEEVVEVPQFVVGALLRNGGEVAKKLESERDVRIIVQPQLEASADLRSVRVIGEQNGVISAIGVISELVGALARVNLHVQIPDWLVGKFIGQGGSHVQGLQELYGVRIQTGSAGKATTITGQEQPAKESHKAILAFIKEETEAWQADQDRQAAEWEHSHFEKQVDIPEWAMPKFIGRAGAHIQQFQQAHGVKTDNVTTRPGGVRVVGCEANVQLACSAILTFVEVEATAWTEAQNQKAEQLRVNSFEQSVTIPQWLLGKFVGKKHANLKRLSQSHSVRMNVTGGASKQDSNSVKVCGKQENVELAVNEIQVFLNQETAQEATREAAREKARQSNFKGQVKIPKEFIPKFIGRRGANVQQLQKEHNVKIETDQSGDITIIGQESEVEGARSQVLAFVIEEKRSAAEQNQNGSQAVPMPPPPAPAPRPLPAPGLVMPAAAVADWKLQYHQRLEASMTAAPPPATTSKQPPPHPPFPGCTGDTQPQSPTPGSLVHEGTTAKQPPPQPGSAAKQPSPQPGCTAKHPPPLPLIHHCSSINVPETPSLSSNSPTRHSSVWPRDERHGDREQHSGRASPSAHSGNDWKERDRPPPWRQSQSPAHGRDRDGGQDRERRRRSRSCRQTASSKRRQSRSRYRDQQHR